MNEHAKKIFISYGRKDAIKFAIKLKDWLKKEGYDPWLDIDNGIQIGELFDVRIEMGISGSKVLIAVLSPWSLRPDGFCRNELLFAQALNIPVIPLRIENIIPPIQIISLNYIDVFQDPNETFTLLPSVLEQVLETGHMPSREWDQKKGNMTWWNTHETLTFQEELVRHGGSFIGREWLFERVNDWIQSSSSKLLLITADVGLGKSAIAAQMTTKVNIRGVHFCTRSNRRSCLPKTWILELIFQLAAQFDVYRKEIEQKSEPDWNNPPESLFRELIVEPLNKHKSFLDLNEPWVFVIDSLDESNAEAGPGLIDLLSRSVSRIPDWLRIIATSRPDQTIISRFKIDGVVSVDIKPEGKENQSDLNIFFDRYYEQILKPKSLANLTDLINRIRIITAGNFQFAKVALDYLNELIDLGNFTDSSIEFPLNLIGLYDDIFRRRFTDISKYEAEIIPIINCLIAAKGPLKDDLLMKACKLNEPGAKRGLLALSQFLHRSDSGVVLFHQSISEWLTDITASNDFTASKVTGHQMIADACFAEYQANPLRMSEYSNNHLATHLAESGRWVELSEILKSTAINLISRWVEKGEGDIGILCLSGLIRYFQKESRETTTTAGWASQLARIFSLRGNYEEAEYWLKEASRSTSFLNGRRIKAIALHELGSIYLYKHDFLSCAKHYQRALLFCHAGLPVYNDEAAANLVGLATLAFEQYQFVKTLKLVTSGIKKAKKSHDIHHIIAGLRLTGATYKSLGKYHLAKTNLSDAYDLCDRYNIQREKNRINMLMGWLDIDISTLNTGLPKEARSHFEEALNGAQGIYDHYIISEAELSLGWLSLIENNQGAAKEFFDEAKSNLLSDEHLELKAGVGSGLAAYAHNLGDFNNAEVLYLESAEFCERNNIGLWHYRSLIGLGAVHWHRGEIQKSELIWEQALKTAHGISSGRLKLAGNSINLCKTDPLKTPR